MLKKCSVTAIAASILLHPSIVSARQWVVLSTTPEHSIDVDSIKGEGDTRTFWSNLVYSEERSVNSSNYGLYGRKYSSVKRLTFVDCVQNKIGTLRAVMYDRNGEAVHDYDISYLSVPPDLESPIPDSIGESELLYVCNLRSANSGKKYNIPVTSTSYSYNFPRATCGDPYQGDGTYFPVFIDGGDTSKIRANLCRDAFATVREDTGIKSTQVASFASYQRALNFANQIGGTVGQPTYYVNGRAME